MIDMQGPAQPACALAEPQSAIRENGKVMEWVTLAEASRILHRHVNAIKSIALAGGIRTKVLPGARILYHRGDAEALAASGA